LKEKADALATAPPAATSAENADTEIAAPDEDAFAERRAVAASLATARARAERLQLEIGAEKPPGSPLSPETELERMRSALAELRKRYTDEHPDVEKLKGQIARLEASLPPARQEPPSPEAELRATEAEIVELAARLAQLQAATSPRPRAIPAPTVPAADATQQRAVLEHEDARRAYQQLLEEWRAAEEADRRNRVPVARFELMRAAVIPRAPDSGSPVLFALAGALLGLAVGLGAALVAEHRDRSVKGPEDLAKILPVPVLAVLPEARPTGKARRSS
jgi:succinoglycan biosynthesis transport protein ExoP